MVNQRTTQLDIALGAMSDPVRRTILERLRAGERSAGELGEPFEVSAAAISRHLRVLERARLITGRRLGRQRRYRLNAAGFRAVDRWIDRYRRFWDQQLDGLGAMLEADHQRTRGAR